MSRFYASLTLLFTYVHSYVIPTPEFQVFGNTLEVSIPHEDGIEVFYFHGRVQRKNQHALKSDAIAMDTRDRTGNTWVIRDDNVQLQAGDVINYWVFVRKNGVGYRNPTGYFMVADIAKPPQSAVSTTERGMDAVPDSFSEKKELDAFVMNDPVNLDSVLYSEGTACTFNCTNQVKNVNETIHRMQSQMESLEKAVDQIMEIVNEQGGMKNSTENVTLDHGQSPTTITSAQIF
uniref:CBM39 domain-containing protein n=1 Tax=Photinus pyralis TaxID=7054 RepID=A0A1Y1M0T1_PHOPY